MRRALALTLVAALLAGCAGDDEPERLTVESRLLGRTLEQVVVDPGERGRPLLVLLHGRGWDPEDVWTLGLAKELRRLGERAPAVVVVAGGEASYYHDRADGRWGTYVLQEAIPAAARALEADAARVAIGGFSMGGFGALDLARLHPERFCAVGAHSPALWWRAAETPAGAFDDAADFRRHYLFDGPFGGRAAMWVDVGRDDPFHDAATGYAALVGEYGRDVTLRTWPGGHEREYWKAHLREYLAFYADALARC